MLNAFPRVLLQAGSGLVPRTEFPAMTQAHLPVQIQPKGIQLAHHEVYGDGQ